MSGLEDKHMSFNRIRDIIYNEDNELKHMESIRKMVQKFEDDFGRTDLSVSLWGKYNVVYNIITNNK